MSNLPPLHLQPDGYFGYDFVAHSFSEDGQYHSLVVGCPLCDEDRGAVYLYLHSGDPSDPVCVHNLGIARLHIADYLMEHNVP